VSEGVTDDGFDPAELAGEPEPVRRYLAHAIRPGASRAPATRLTMRGHIKAGLWLPFEATEEIDGRSFDWRARVRLGPLTLLTVDDSFASGGSGATSGRLFGRLRMFHSSDENTTRSAAGRAAVESFWAPLSLLPGAGASWRAESDSTIVATFDAPPERAEITLEIDDQGALRSAWTERWGNAGQDHFGYIPCGGTMHAERRFGDLVLPSHVTVGWWFGSERYEPFFEAEILDAVAAAGAVTAAAPVPPDPAPRGRTCPGRRRSARADTRR
jgi:hypothetical protein